PPVSSHATSLLAEACERKSGHKKPGLNKGSAGITSVPGLFSELFNVAASRPAQMTTEWRKASPKRAFRQGWPMVNPSGRPHGGRGPCALSNHEGERASWVEQRRVRRPLR